MCLFGKHLLFLVGKMGFEPTPPFGDKSLKLARLPIPPLAQKYSVLQGWNIQITYTTGFRIFSGYSRIPRARSHGRVMVRDHTLHNLVKLCGADDGNRTHIRRLEISYTNRCATPANI